MCVLLIYRCGLKNLTVVFAGKVGQAVWKKKVGWVSKKSAGKKRGWKRGVGWREGYHGSREDWLGRRQKLELNECVVYVRHATGRVGSL